MKRLLLALLVVCAVAARAEGATFPLPITFTETAGIARTSEITFVPAVVWLPDASDVPTSTTSLSLRTASGGGSCVDAQFDAHVRWYGDPITGTSLRIKGLQVTAAVTVGANSTVTYWLDNSGACAAPSGIAITTVGSYLNVNTNDANHPPTGVQNVRIPASGATGQNILDQVQLCTSSSGNTCNTYESIIATGNQGGLCVVGVTTAENPSTTTNNQASDFCSFNDNASNHTITQIRTGPLWAQIRIGRARGGALATGLTLRSSNAACSSPPALNSPCFQGMNTETAAGTPTPITTKWDVYLDFYRGVPGVQIKVVSHAQESIVAGNGLTTPDAAIDKLVFRTISAITGATTTMTVRDEAAAAKVTTVTANAASTVRQTINYGTPPSKGGDYGFGLTLTGALSGALNASSVTMLESVCQIEDSGNKWGVAFAPRLWREKFPMGCAFDPASAQFDLELLNPTQGSIQTLSNTRTYHVLRSSTKPSWDAWMLFNVGARDNTALKQLVQRTAGWHEAASQTAEGTQRYGLVARMGTGADGWSYYQSSKVWTDHLPAPLSLLPTSNGACSTSTTLYCGTRVSTTWTTQDRWFRILFDKAQSADNAYIFQQNSYRSWQAKAWSHSGPNFGWYPYGSYLGQGDSLVQWAGAHFYNVATAPFFGYLASGHLYPQYQEMFVEMVSHGVGFDQYHCSTGQSGFCGGFIYNEANPATWYQQTPKGVGNEVSQLSDWLVLAYLWTGHDYFLEAIKEHKTYIVFQHLGGGSGLNRSKSASATGTFTNGSAQITNLSISNSNFVASNNYEVQWGSTNGAQSQCNITTSGPTTLSCPGHLLPTGSTSSVLGQGICLTGGDVDACTTSNDNNVRRIVAVPDANTITINAAWPSPSKTNVTWDRITHTGASVVGSVSLSGANLQAQNSTWRSGVHTIRTRVSDSLGGIRATSWPMLGLTRIFTVLGDTDTAQKAEQMWTNIWFRAQQSGDSASNAALGGSPGFVNEMCATSDCWFSWDGQAHPYAVQEETQTQYPLRAVMAFSDIAAAARSCLSPCTPFTTQFTAADVTNAQNYILGYVLTHATGANGTTSIQDATVLGTTTIPVMRAGHMKTATQYSPFAYPYPVTTSPTTSNSTIFTQTDNLQTTLPGMPSQSAFNTGVSGLTDSGRALLTVDALVWLAEKYYKASGDSARCSYAYALAKEVFADNELGFNTASAQDTGWLSKAGVYIDPTNSAIYGQSNLMVGGNGAPAQSNRFGVRQWIEGYTLASLEAAGGLACGVNTTTSASLSQFTASPSSLNGDDVSLSTLSVITKNSDGAVLSGKLVSLTQGAGRSTISPATAQTDANGLASFTARDAGQETVTYQATVVTDSVTITQQPSVTFFGFGNGSLSTASAAPSSVLADGTTAALVTVTVLDGLSQPVPGKMVSLAQGGCRSTISPVVTNLTNAQGQVVFGVTNLTAEACVYTPTDTTDNVPITSTAAVTFTSVPTPPPPTPVPGTGPGYATPRRRGGN